MAEKEDLRVKRTKKMLADAFLKLLDEKSFEDITINELCSVAGVRRATFYKHYSDKFSFLTSFTRSLRDRFDTVIWDSENPINTPEYYVRYARRIVGYIDEHYHAIEHLVKSDLFPAALAIIVEQNYADTCERLKESVSMGMKLSASIEVTAAVCSGGIAEAIYLWIKSDRNKSPDELADEIGNLVSSLIK